MSRAALLKLVTGLLIAYWLTMFVITHIPLPKLDVPRHSDKLVHFVGYGLLMFLFRFRQQLAGSSGWKGSVWFAAIILIVYAVVDEVLQAPVNRTPDLQDGIADAIGVLLGAILFFLLKPSLEYVIKRICGEAPPSTR